MGGLSCAKTIIDNGNALTQAMQCMNASIHLNSSRVQPTYEQRDRFLAATNQVAKIAAEIEEYVREGGEYDGGDNIKPDKPDPDAQR